jgi:phage shock protein E
MSTSWPGRASLVECGVQSFRVHQREGSLLIRKRSFAMKRLIATVLLFAAPVTAIQAATPQPRPNELIRDGANPLIDYGGFRALVGKIEPVRQKRLIAMDGFRRMADASSRVLVLDARSREAFAEGHMAGAVNLPFSDFTAESLAAAIGPDKGRPILIYCNNNFTDNRRPVMTKRLELALNVQTFVNLHGYGYRNVWELGEAVTTTDPRVRWTGSLAGEDVLR